MKKVILMLTAAALVASCSKTEMNEAPNADGVLIQAQPVHQLVDGTVTRAPFNGNISSTNPLEAKVVTYAPDGNTIHANGLMNFTTTTDPVAYTSVESGGSNKFPAQNSDIYTLYGFYPAASWTTVSPTTSGQSKFKFSGKEDIMIAAADTTSADGVSSGLYPKLTFKHQLTKFVVKVQAANDNAVTRWGDVTEITLTQILGSTANVTNEGAYDMQSFNVDFSGAGSPMSFWLINDGLTYTDLAFTAQAAELYVPNATASNILPVAYSMVRPFASKADSDITLSVKAANQTAQSVNLNVPAPKDSAPTTAGHAYTITLTFTDELLIVATAEVIDWIDGGEIGGIVM